MVRQFSPFLVVILAGLLAGPSNAQTMLVGDEVAGCIREGEEDSFPVLLERGSIIALEMVGEASDMDLYIRANDGRTIASCADTSSYCRIVQEIPRTGVYTIAVRNYKSNRGSMACYVLRGIIAN